MEEFVYKLVENTFKNHSIEEAKEIISKRILWYENELRKARGE